MIARDERYNELYDAAYRRWRTLRKEDVARDSAQVEAYLNALAMNRRLKVERYLTEWGVLAVHAVSVLDDRGAEIAEIGGYIEIGELRRGAGGGCNWPFEKQQLPGGRVRISLMITDMFPDIEMFRREDGSRVDLGLNDDDHYYDFSVEIDERDLTG